jgi:hypothetical protein
VAVPEAETFPEPALPQFRIAGRAREMLDIAYFSWENFDKFRS